MKDYKISRSFSMPLSLLKWLEEQTTRERLSKRNASASAIVIRALEAEQCKLEKYNKAPK